MLLVINERDPRDCQPFTDAERRLDVAREQLRHAVSSGSARNLSVSSLGRMSSHETMVHANAVVVLEAKCCRQAQGKGVGFERRLSGKFVNVRHPSFLRDAEGRRVEDQSLWGGVVHEHLQEEIPLRRR